MKGFYDREMTERKFEVDYDVMILLHMNNHPLKPKFQGP